jgi:peroxiredoxin
MESPSLTLAIVALVLVGLEGWLLVQLLRQNGRLLVRLDALEERLAGSGAIAASSANGLPVGTAAPAFSLPGVFGETLTLDALRARGNPILLLFTDPDCGPCNGLMPDFGGWQRAHGHRLTIVSVSRGSVESNRAKATEHGLNTVLLQQQFEVAEAFRAHGTPAAVLVRPDGTIGSPVALGADQIRALAATAIGAPAPLAR